MQVLFESSVPACAQLHREVEPRVKVALRRLAWLVPSVRVRLSEVAGNDDLNQRWQVELYTTRFGTIEITSLSHDAVAGLNRALVRAARVLLSAWCRTLSEPQARRESLPRY